MSPNFDAVSRVWLPADVSGLRQLGQLLDQVNGNVGVVKIGLQLMHRVGTPRVVKYVKDRDARVSLFTDGKLDDIPNTVGEATEALADLGADFINLHVSAGPKAIEAAAEKKKGSLLLGVTVLTSLKPRDLYDMYVKQFPGAPDFNSLSQEDQQKYLQDVVLEMAILAQGCGADGVICSPQELDVLTQDAGLNGFRRYTPGIRPQWAAKNDQERITTPGDAIRKGATGIIVGRPISNPPKEIGTPLDATRLIIEEVRGALAEMAAG